MRRAVALAVLGAFALVGAARSSPAGDALDKRAVEALGIKWFKARPKTKFEEWDPKVRSALLAEAKALGRIPEGALDEVRDALWHGVKKSPPGAPPKEPGKPERMTTPYGTAWWIQNGRGSKQGLVLGLHGGGEGAGDAGEAAGKWSLPGCIGIYPQGIKLVHDTWNTVHGERFLLTLIELAKAQFEVDPDRVYSMGFSMGGTGSWFLAGRHPDLLAASCPCAGVLMAAPKSQVPRKEDVEGLQHGFLPNVRNLAMYWFIGLADHNCMPGTYLYAWDALQDLRKQDAGGYEKLSFYAVPGLAHTFPPGEPGKLLDWAAKQRREPHPKKVVWEIVDTPFPMPEDDIDRKVGRYVKRDFYWLHCDRPLDKCTATATLADNVVDLDLSLGDPEDWTIWLSPKLIDPAKDVVVRARGKELYRGRPVPDVATVLETLDARLDRTLTYDRRVVLAKP